MAPRRAGRVAGALVGTLVLAGAGYLTADAYDVVPGVVTLEPEPAPPSPFPTPPGAVAAPEPTPVVPTLDAAAPLPDGATLAGLVERAATHEWMGSSVGVVVADQLTGEVLVDRGGATPRIPASTAKVLTGMAAVSALGPERTLRTAVVRTQPDRIVLVGGGDVMLSAADGDPRATNGRAGLGDLATEVARALRLAGTTEVSLAVDDQLFTGATTAPGWDPDTLEMGFVAPVTALEVDIAKVRPGPYPPRHQDPSLHAAEVFADLLRDAGVTVRGDVGRTDAPDDAPELAVVESAPLGDVVAYALQTSDNTVTEVLGRLVALERGLPASFEGATTAVLAEVRELGLDVTGARLADCSGLADGSVLPARLLVDALLVMTDPDVPGLRTVALDLPVAGWQGTLAERLAEGPAAGLVRAKTGSLPRVTSLAGTVLTQDGRQLVFAVLADRTPPGGQLGPRRVIDALVQQLAGCTSCTLP